MENSLSFMNQNNPTTTTKYRADIDGLRAFAVLAVIIFHLKESLLPGGFIGVDIFFVISGYLISDHIMAELKMGRFSFAQFYLKRSRRILPALYGVIALTTFVCMFLFLPEDVRRTAKIGTEALLYKSNYYFAYYLDYFSPLSAEFPFLHLWSLSVEEQFYFIFPAILFVIYKFISRWKNYDRYLPVLLIFILGLALIRTEIDLNDPTLRKIAFYGLGSRMSELLVGAVLASLNFKIKRQLIAEILTILSLITLFGCLFYFNSATRFPGTMALIPCLATAVIIATQRHTSTAVSKLLSFSPLVYIGLISYSLYLYHWPVMAIVRYTSIEKSFNITQALGIFLLSLLLGFLSWRFIERPFRKPVTESPIKGLFKFLFVPTAVLFLALRFVMYIEKSPWFMGDTYTLVTETFLYLDDSKYCHSRFSEKDCIFGEVSKKPDALLLGDSHAGHYQPFLDEVGQSQHFSYMARTYDACVPLVTQDQSIINHFTNEPHCLAQLSWAYENFDHYKTIIFAGRWDSFLNGADESVYEKALPAMIQNLIAKKKQVVFLEQIPDCPGITDFYHSRFTIKRFFMNEQSERQNITNNCGKSSGPANQRLKNLVERHGAKFIPALADFQSQKMRMPFDGNVFFYKDATHLNQKGSLELGKWSGAHSEKFKSLTKNDR